MLTAFWLAYVPDAPIFPPQTSHKKKPEEIQKNHSKRYYLTRPPPSSEGGHSCGSGNSSKAPAELAFVKKLKRSILKSLEKLDLLKSPETFILKRYGLLTYLIR